MIQATELRIGNIVSNGIEPFKANIYTIQVCECGTALGEIHPIPLTENILLKCGFMLKYGQSYYYPEKDEEVGDDILFIQKYSDGWRVYIHQPIRKMDTMITVVESLHELQNLYFALTGQELNVELWAI